MKQTLASYSVNGGSQTLVFGPFARGDVIDYVTVHCSSNVMALGTTLEVAMLASREQPIGTSDETLSATPATIGLDVGDSLDVAVGEYVQDEKRYLAVRITEAGAIAGAVSVGVRYGRRGR